MVKSFYLYLFSSRPRSTIEPDFEEFLYKHIKPRATIAIVGGSDLEKMFQQLNGKRVLSEFDYIFPENGLVQIEKGVEVGKVNIVQHLGEDTIQRFINFVLKYLSELQLPFKRGTFLEFRNGKSFIYLTFYLHTDYGFLYFTFDQE